MALSDHAGDNLYQMTRDRLKKPAFSIERKADDSPVKRGFKDAAIGLTEYGEAFNQRASEIPGRISGAVTGAFDGAVDTVSKPFQSPSTAPLMPENLPAIEQSSVAQPQQPAGNEPAMSHSEHDAAMADDQQEKPSEDALKEAVTGAVADWGARVKKAPKSQTEKAGSILKEEGVDVDETFKKVAPEMEKSEFSKDEKAWFLMEFGMRLMAEGGKSGATVGSSFGAAGAGTMGSIQASRQEKKADAKEALYRKEGKEAAQATATEDTRRWDLEHGLKVTEAIIKANENDYKILDSPDKDGNLLAFDKKNQRTVLVTDPSGNPVKNTGKGDNGAGQRAFSKTVGDAIKDNPLYSRMSPEEKVDYRRSEEEGAFSTIESYKRGQGQSSPTQAGGGQTFNEMPSAKGYANGTIAKDGNGNPVKIVQNGQWVDIN